MSREVLYLTIYNYYKKQITDGAIAPNTRLPSIRKCAEMMNCSMITCQTAYQYLAAEGYLIAKEKSGYYVTELNHNKKSPERNESDGIKKNIRFDLSSGNADRNAFDFNIWRRYMKSALRQDEMLLSYGDAAGEYELRRVLSDYIREKRNVVCRPDQIVIGAGHQSLLHILCSLTEPSSVSFPDKSFVQGSAVFRSHGYQVTYRNKDGDMIYVSPSHMTRFGDVMPMKRRLELVQYSAEKGSLIIEDDYESDFLYISQPTPSLYFLSPEDNVIYISSFSKLLLPGIRISFMVLPKKTAEKYCENLGEYSQTASKTEQTALCSYIRDGRLSAQIRKVRRLYTAKTKNLYRRLQAVFQDSAIITMGENGLLLKISAQSFRSPRDFYRLAEEKGIALIDNGVQDGKISVILSCSAVPEDDFDMLSKELYELYFA